MITFFNSHFCSRALHAAAVLTLSTSGFADTLSNFEWKAPERYSNGGALPAGTLTGYRVYQKTVDGFRHFATTTDTKAQVPDGTYAVAATFPGGQTGLSLPSTFPDWEAALAKPDASNTVTPATNRSDIQAKVSAMMPGDVLYLRGGEYSFTQSGNFIDANASGEKGKYVTIRNYPGEVPTIVGMGWDSEDTGPIAAQTLMKISADYVRLYGLGLTRSGKHGITVDGNHCWVEECSAYSNWYGNIVGGVNSSAGRDVNGGTIIYCSAHHSRRGSGIVLGLDDRKDYNADDWTIKRSLSYRNGFNDDNRINSFGGGNSDGTGCTKYAHDNYAFDFEWQAYGRANRIHDYHVVENLLYFNADDGANVSSGEGTLFVGNVAAANGPSGTKGYKQLREHYETSTYSGNIAMGSERGIYPSDTLYVIALSATPISAGDTITGITSGTSARVISGFMFSNDNSAREWKSGNPGVLYITDLKGAFNAREDLSVSGIAVAKVANLGQTVACDHRVNSTDYEKPFGRNNEIAWTALFHNPPGEGSLRGFHTQTSTQRGGNATNNLSYFNQDKDLMSNFTERNNFKNDSPAAPGIANPDYEFEEPVLVGETVREQWQILYREIQSNLMPVKGGNLHGKGHLDLNYYHATAADDPTAPSDPDDHTKLHWFRTGKAAPAPDIGAVQYQAIFPPILGEGESTIGNPPATDTTAPLVAITSPSDGSALEGTSTKISVSASDNVAVTKTELYIDGEFARTSTSSSASFNWHTTKLAMGAHTLQAYAYDAAGNIGGSHLITVYKLVAGESPSGGSPATDTTAPLVAITSPSDGSALEGTSTKISVSASDNVAVTKMELYIDGKLARTSTSSSASFNWHTTKVAKGAHTLQAYAYDAAGNTGGSHLITVYK